MNSRVAYQELHNAWIAEQDNRVKPFAWQAWRWKIQQLMERKDGLTEREDAFKCEVKCKRWPYVDQYKEAMADKVNLENRTINRDIICDQRGYEYEEVEKQRQNEDGKIPVKVEGEGKK